MVIKQFGVQSSEFGVKDGKPQGSARFFSPNSELNYSELL